MTDARTAWNEAGEHLTGLGQKLKIRYEEQRGPEGAQTRQELADTAKRLGAAVQDAFETIGSAARDKSVQADVKQVGQSVYEAMGATFGQISEDLRKAFTERKGGSGHDTEPGAGSTPEPTSEAPRPLTAGEPPAEPPTAGQSSAEQPPKVEPWGTP